MLPKISNRKLIMQMDLKLMQGGDWPNLMPIAIDVAADKIENSGATNNAERVVLVPATGSGCVLMLSRRVE